MSGKMFTREDWEKELNGVKIRKQDMNKLVMNFLVTEGYSDAAVKFHMESGTEHIDLASITDRTAVKEAVQLGNVEDAIEKVKDLNPEILETDPHLFFHLQQQRMIEFIRNGRVEEALEFAQEALVPKGVENLYFLEELERTIALLAFEDVSNCPSGELLDMSQRLKTASEVNAAILTSQGHEKESKLQRLLKMLIWTQNQLNEEAAYPCINDLSTAILEDPAL